jgi:hypothetical protein
MKKFLIRFVLVAIVVGAAWGGYRFFQQMPQRQQQIATTRVRHKEGKPSDSGPRRIGGFPSCAASVEALSFVDICALFCQPIEGR